MANTLLMVGTTKGAFFFTTDEIQSSWKMTGPHLAGWEIYSLLCHQRGDGSPPRFVAGTSHWSYGATIRTSDDFGETWQQQEGRPEYPKETGWKLNKIWQLVAHPTQRDTIYAGVDEAGLFVSRDRANTWTELTSLTRRPDRAAWQPGGGGLCLHTVVVDPTRPDRIWIGISAVGAFRTDDAGETWTNLNKTLPNQATGSPDNTVAHCIHKIVQDTKSPDTLYMQFHGGVYKSTDAGDHWGKIENGLPSNFGFPMAVTGGGDLFICPLDSDEKRYTKGGKLAVYRSRDRGESWQALSKGLPDDPCYVGVLRDAMTADQRDGVYFGTTMGEVFASPDAGETWARLPATLPRVTTVKVVEIEA